MNNQQLEDAYMALSSIPTFIHMHVDESTDRPSPEEYGHARQPDARHKAALYYAAIGIPVFPCVPLGKKPAVAGGFKTATTDNTQINQWWARADYNIGIPTGCAFDVIDIDNVLSGWPQVWADIDAGRITPFHIVQTPRGYHLYIPPIGAGNTVDKTLGVDFRGVGGYVVAPPSIIAWDDGKRGGTYRHLYGWPSTLYPPATTPTTQP